MSEFYLDDTGRYKKGDPPPEGYIEWHEWAGKQSRSGLKQSQCVNCRRWRFPQEFPCSCERLL